MHIRAIIFDMDGLMIDTETLYWAAGREVARRYGKEVRDATLGRMIPVFCASPYAGVVAERFERVRVMITADLLRALYHGTIDTIAFLVFTSSPKSACGSRS